MSTKKETGLSDRENKMIHEDDWVSLDKNMTADDSFSYLPNGWMFEEDDIYQVYYDERINNWSLRLGIEPDSPYHIKLMNHAVGLLHSGDTTITSAPEKPIICQK